MSHLTSHHTLPPFASDIPTAPLVSISLAKLESNNASECAAFFDASKRLGFFYLDLDHSQLGEALVREAEELNALQKKWFALPAEEKDRFGRDKVDPFYAYRYTPRGDDAAGNPLRNETYNVSFAY